MDILDWYSRFVITLEVSNTLDGNFCQEALVRALEVKKPVIFNSDQGSQFTSKDFTRILKDAGVRISDGKGRSLDNMFVERLWRPMKYEEVFLKDYDSVKEAVLCLGSYY